jgi:hypothetical protein
MSNVMGGLFGLIFIAQLIFNFIGPIIAGIWLAYIGEWSLIGLGFAYMLGGVMFVSVLLLPGMIFMAGGIAIGAERNPFVAVLTGLPILAWTYAVAIGSSAFVMHTATDYIDWNDHRIAFLLWGASIALAPWSFLASKDNQSGNDNGGSTMTALFLNIAIISAAISYYLDPFNDLMEWVRRIGFVMAVSYVLQALTYIFFSFAGRRY